LRSNRTIVGLKRASSAAFNLGSTGSNRTIVGLKREATTTYGRENLAAIAPLWD